MNAMTQEETMPDGFRKEESDGEGGTVSDGKTVPAPEKAEMTAGILPAEAAPVEGSLSGVAAEGGGEAPEEGPCTRLSRGISLLLHPFLVPVYTVLVLLFGDTIMSNIAAGLKWFFVLVVALNTLVIPAIFIALMRTFGVLSDLSLRRRRERMLPLAVVAVCYLVCALMLSDVLVAFLIRKFLYAALGCVLLALAVNFRWKISLHLVAAGGAVAMLLIVAVSRFGNFTGTIVTAILLSGLLASARLWLGCHTPAQVAAGFFGGFAAASLVMLAL